MLRIERAVCGIAVATLFAMPLFAQHAANASNPAVEGTSAERRIQVSANAGLRSYVSRYDVFVAPSYLNTPKLNMVQRGVNGEFAVNLKPWLGIGIDYSYLRGSSNLQPQLLTTSLQQMLASVVPPGTQPHVPFDSTVYGIGAGPQVNLRRFRRVTLFARPAGGVLHETTLLKPKDPMTTMLVGQIVPGMRKTDTTIFYGGGGGFDLQVSQQIGLRFAVDTVHMKLYSNLLTGGENAVRISIAPVFHSGSNVK